MTSLAGRTFASDSAVGVSFVRENSLNFPLRAWKGGGGNPSEQRRLFSRFNEQRLTLRIHRGRGSVHNGSNNGSNTRSPESSSRSSVKREKIKISVSYPSTETLNTKCNTLERTPSRCSQISVHYSNGQTQTQLCPASRNTHLKVNPSANESVPSSTLVLVSFPFNDRSLRSSSERNIGVSAPQSASKRTISSVHLDEVYDPSDP